MRKVKYYVFENGEYRFSCSSLVATRKMVRNRNWGISVTGVMREDHKMLIIPWNTANVMGQACAQTVADVAHKAGVTQTALWNGKAYAAGPDGSWRSADGRMWTNPQGRRLNTVQAAMCRRSCFLLLGGPMNNRIVEAYTVAVD